MAARARRKAKGTEVNAESANPGLTAIRTSPIAPQEREDYGADAVMEVFGAPLLDSAKALETGRARADARGGNRSGRPDTRNRRKVPEPAPAQPATKLSGGLASRIAGKRLERMEERILSLFRSALDYRAAAGAYNLAARDSAPGAAAQAIGGAPPRAGQPWQQVPAMAPSRKHGDSARRGAVAAMDGPVSDPEMLARIEEMNGIASRFERQAIEAAVLIRQIDGSRGATDGMVSSAGALQSVLDGTLQQHIATLPCLDAALPSARRGTAPSAMPSGSPLARMSAAVDGLAGQAMQMADGVEAALGAMSRR